MSRCLVNLRQIVGFRWICQSVVDGPPEAVEGTEMEAVACRQGEGPGVEQDAGAERARVGGIEFVA